METLSKMVNSLLYIPSPGFSEDANNSPETATHGTSVSCESFDQARIIASFLTFPIKSGRNTPVIPDLPESPSTIIIGRAKTLANMNTMARFKA